MKLILLMSSLLPPTAWDNNEPARSTSGSTVAISVQETRQLPPPFGPFVNLKPEDVAEVK